MLPSAPRPRGLTEASLRERFDTAGCRTRPETRRSSDANRVATPLEDLGYPASADIAADRLAHSSAAPFPRVLAYELVGLLAAHVVSRLGTERLSCRIVDSS